MWVSAQSQIDAKLAETHGTDERSGEVVQALLSMRKELVQRLKQEKLDLDRGTAMLRSYRRVARYPWLSAPPDRPETK